MWPLASHHYLLHFSCLTTEKKSYVNGTRIRLVRVRAKQRNTIYNRGKKRFQLRNRGKNGKTQTSYVSLSVVSERKQADLLMYCIYFRRKICKPP